MDSEQFLEGRLPTTVLLVLYWEPQWGGPWPNYVNIHGEEKTHFSTELAPLGDGWGILPGLYQGPGAARQCFVFDNDMICH